MSIRGQRSRTAAAAGRRLDFSSPGNMFMKSSPHHILSKTSSFEILIVSLSDISHLQDEGSSSYVSEQTATEA